MRAGRLRHSITFQEPEEERDPTTGAVKVVWVNAWLDSETELVDVPAEVLTGPGRELLAAGAKHAETSARINLRWFPGLSATWRILWDGRVYDITSIETDATARKEWRLQCKDGVSDGR